jgi:hypothetical protein
MTAKPLLALVALATASTTIGVTSTPVGAEPSFVFHFKGRAAQATLTDCTTESDTCVAFDIFAAQERFQSRGDKVTRPFLDVFIYDVVIDGSEPDGFTATLVAIGVAEAPEVSVAKNLSAASASVEDVALSPCEVVEEVVVCDTETTVGAISIEVEWTATGKRETSAFHAKFDDGSVSSNFHAVDAFRLATASGEVTGDVPHEALSETPLFPPSIFSTNQGTVERGAAG